ncbi:MAG: 30S ribosomal protein S2 [Bacteroidia bacterium]
MSARTSFNELLETGAHFGHLKSKWNPAMAPYIYAEKNGIHIIDLNKTIVKIDEAAEALKQIVRSGRKILFVATKKQAKDIVAEKIKAINMPYVTERWPGGMLTNFATIRKSVRRMSQIDKMNSDGTFTNISKRERLQFSRERAKLEINFGSIADLSRLPAALFIVDITKEHIAVAEAKRLNIPTFAIVDTNSNPNLVDYVIPANDDASTSIAYIIELMATAIKEGLSDRKMDKEAGNAEESDTKEFSKEEAEELADGAVIKGATKGTDEEEKGGAKKPRRRVTTAKK